MREIIYWISMGLMWFACGLNIYAMIRSNRNYKTFKEMRERYEEAVERYEKAIDHYYDIIKKYTKENNNETDAL